MSVSFLPAPDFQAARQLLVRFSAVEARAVASEAEKQQLQEAVLRFVDLSEHQNLGVCADNAEAGVAALTAYLQAMGYGLPAEPESAEESELGPVYLKFSTQRMAYYVEPYEGRDRGVLLACQSSQHDALNGTFGFLPLDLFDSSASA